METRVMEQTTTTLIYITTTDKHGVPPTKRLFRVAMLDPSQGFIDPWGKFGDLELPSVVGLELEFDSEDDMPSRTPTCMEYTR
ncbi:hypothetical protein Tco_0727389 [Tanacetum coccineum]|uniref:Uncharacterized protein n=1 Tax=Tanacetum coccineum TaxID=301880 RepID=A0ABQ4YL91_9ASTR